MKYSSKCLECSKICKQIVEVIKCPMFEEKGKKHKANDTQ